MRKKIMESGQYKAISKKLVYASDSGLFYWIEDIGKRIKKGDIAGTTVHGYIKISHKKKQFNAHRLAWYMTFGSIESGIEIDHINHNRSDNRIDNLRIVRQQDNQKNRTKPITNTSGTVGVYWRKNRKVWVATITVARQFIYLGYFPRYSDAVNARKNAEVLYGFHENHGKDI